MWAGMNGTKRAREREDSMGMEHRRVMDVRCSYPGKVALLLLSFLVSLTAQYPMPPMERDRAAHSNGECGPGMAGRMPSSSSTPRIIDALKAIGLCETGLNHPERAAKSFQRVVALDPNNAQGWFYLGVNHLALNQPEQAAEDFRTAAKLKADDPSAWFNLGLALQKSGKCEEAFDALGRGLLLVPGDETMLALARSTADQVAQKASERIERKDFAEARRLLLKVSGPFGELAEWNNLLGYAEFRLGNAKAAIEHLQKALHLEPDNEQYLMDLAQCLILFRAYDAARSFLEVGVRRSPDSVRIKFSLALAYLLDDHAPAATPLLFALIGADAKFEPAYTALGMIYESAHDWAALVSLGQRLRAASPDNPTGWYLEGAGLLSQPSDDPAVLAGAIASLRKSTTGNSGSSAAHYALAKAYVKAGDSEAAVRELKETLRLNPDHSGAHYVLARVYQKLGTVELAAKELAAFGRAKESEKSAELRLLVTEIAAKQ